MSENRSSARWVIVVAAFAVVLAAAPYKLFDLDRFFVPKELVLNAAALIAALLVLRRAREIALARVDLLLGAYLALSTLSALFAANHWLGTRALAITLASAAIFWAARAASEGGAWRTIVAACAIATVLGAVTSLAQAYGVTSEYFSLNRAPGGTFGNRNFMAHLAAIGVPATVLCTITARRAWSAAFFAAGMAVLAGALVMSRTRAAWLALAAGAAVLVLGLWRAHHRWSDPRAARRMQLLTAAALLGVLAALWLPNTLEWKSDSPYLDTVTGVVNYREGSGHGRVVQYTNTLRIAAAHPLLGVGPGNWAVAYPRVAAENDPSLDPDDGMTANPWPSSDWMAIAAERGFPALVVLMLVLFGLAMGAWRRADHATSAEQYVEGLALASALVVTVIVGAFDAVLLLPAPALIAWALFGALSAPAAARSTTAIGVPGRRRMMIVVFLIGAAGVTRSAAQLTAMAVFSGARDLRQIENAARLDPGSYRIQMKLASLYEERGNCEKMRAAAMAARSLYPNAPDPRRMIRACGRRAPR
jgi:O-antigen ligase